MAKKYLLFLTPIVPLIVRVPKKSPVYLFKKAQKTRKNRKTSISMLIFRQDEPFSFVVTSNMITRFSTYVNGVWKKFGDCLRIGFFIFFCFCQNVLRILLHNRLSKKNIPSLLHWFQKHSKTNGQIICAITLHYLCLIESCGIFF